MPPLNPSPCQGREEIIQLFLDGELTQPERENFLAHVESCLNCQRLLQQWQTLFAELDTLKEAIEPVDLVNQVMVRLSQPTAASPTRLSQLVLAGQFVIGLALLVMVWPLISAFFGSYDLTPAWPNLFNLTTSLTQGLAETSQDLSLWLDSQRRQALGWLRFDLSSGLVLALIAGCALVWLAGNTVLLRANPPSFRNGGTS